MSDEPISTNERAERLMGRRRSDVVSIDQPCELGYWCPVCRVPAETNGEYDERLHWSEYNGFLWCEVCNVDFPSALCVPLHERPDPDRPWRNHGVAAAVDVFLDSVERAAAVPEADRNPQ